MHSTVAAGSERRVHAPHSETEKHATGIETCTKINNSLVNAAAASLLKLTFTITADFRMGEFRQVN